MEVSKDKMSNGKRFAEPEKKEKNTSMKRVFQYLLLVILLVLISCGIIISIRNFKENVEPVSAEESQQNMQEEMPQTIDGYQVLGKIKIESLEVEKYILDSREEKALEKETCKWYGPNMNEKGNFCIAGHNEETIFKNLETLENGAMIQLIDRNETVVEYEVYDSFTVEPTDLSVLLQEEDKQEITLITCQEGALTRRIVKAKKVEVEENEKVENTANDNQTKE